MILQQFYNLIDKADRIKLIITIRSLEKTQSLNAHQNSHIFLQIISFTLLLIVFTANDYC